MTQVLTVEQHHGVAHVQLNRADKLNALNMALFDALDKTSKALRKDRALKAVIVSGAGPDFCTGLDVKSVMGKPGNAVRLLRKWLPGNANLAQRVSYNWRKIPAPVIFALHGRCWGGGLQIALGGDFRIAAPDCSLAVMESRWGLVPDMAGNVPLRELVAKDQALRWAMTAAEIPAAEALEHGLISAIADDPLEAADELVQQLVNRSPDTLAAIKRLYNRNWLRSDRAMLAAESLVQISMFRNSNRKIAMRREQGETDLSYQPRR